MRRPHVALRPLLALPLLAVVAAVFALSGGSQLPPERARAGGLVITVDTTENLNINNGNCDLSEAINASNSDGADDQCLGSGDDMIVFSIGAGNPIINVVAPYLPVVTDTLDIDGATASGKVVLHGDGNFAGLYIAGTGADGSTIRNLVINSFNVGIRTSSSDVTIAGNYLGTDATGTTASPNGYGIYADGSGNRFGGTIGVTPGGPCTGECNLISGNDVNGIYLEDTTGAVIQGNFIGTNLTGTAALGNAASGIVILNADAIIGGSAASGGNLISGNGNNGIGSEGGQVRIWGNRIGTNAAGTGAIANARQGILMNDADDSVIGSSDSGHGNLISGNDVSGIYAYDTTNLTVHYNLIGTQADGTSALGNGYDGVRIAPSTAPDHYQFLYLNTIAFNGRDGIRIDGYGGADNYGTAFFQNSIHSNTGLGIDNFDNGNLELAPPTITNATAAGASGTSSCPNCGVQVYSDSADEGRVFAGNVTADGGGNWTYTGSLSGPNVTALVSNTIPFIILPVSTSEFSAPFALPATPTPSPSPSPSPTPTPTPTPIATASPTVTPTPTATPPGQSPSPTLVGQTPMPTLTPGGPTPSPTSDALSVAWGDDNCSGEADPVDSLLTLRHDAGLSVDTGDCPALGTPITLLIATALIWGDVDCSGSVDPVDSLKLLRFDAGLTVAQEPGCPHLGSQVAISAG